MVSLDEQVLRETRVLVRRAGLGFSDLFAQRDTIFRHLPRGGRYWLRRPLRAAPSIDRRLGAALTVHVPPGFRAFSAKTKVARVWFD
jgi:hypothetical protein